MDVSVVVCTRNRPETLAAALEAIEHQTLQRERYEVIVVDDGSTDDTAAVARAAGAQVIRFPEHRGVAAARNEGFRSAQAPIVAFTDDDCVPAREWLEELLKAFRDRSVDGVAGCVVPASTTRLMLRYIEARNPLAPLPADLGTSRRPLERLAGYLKETVRGRDAGGSGEIYALATANAAFRVSLLESIGGFEERFEAAEDEELCKRAHRRPGGARLVYRESAVVRHIFKPELNDTIRRARYYGRGSAALASRYEDAKLIVYPFPIVIGAVAALAALARRPGLLAAAGLLPLATYAGWPLQAIRQRRVEPLLYPYLQLVEEVATMQGEVSAWRP
jgi:glycosyltransferase involved in cell wall biosynthesis